MRLAWFTPLPPAKTGVASYNTELLPGLAADYHIDLFVGGRADQFIRPDERTSLFSAHDFVWRHLRQPYDLVVYQLGNSPYHDYVWAYLVRYPGLVVLHDGQLHHSRARALLQENRTDDYRREFAFNHPDARADIAELGVAGLLGSFTYQWPMLRIVAEAARLLVVHNAWLASHLRAEYTSSRVMHVEMGVPSPTIDAGARAVVRTRHSIPDEAVVFAAFGKVTPEKCISKALASFAAVLKAVPRCHLILVGEAVGFYDAEAEAKVLGIEEHVTMAGFVPEEELADYLAAVDVCLCLRWPSSRETSASWLRCLAAGLPTVITDLVHLGDIPALDPRDWTPLHAPPSDVDFVGRPDAPAAVSIDIMDFEHSLGLAMRRLAADAHLRQVLGRAARELWKARFTIEVMIAGYQAAIDAALAAPPPLDSVRAKWPKHLIRNGTELAASLLAHLTVPEARLGGLWSAGQSVHPVSAPRDGSADGSPAAEETRSFSRNQ